MSLSECTLHNAAVVALVRELERGIEIISEIDDDDFAVSRNGESSVGAHIRHNLEFVNALLNGIAGRRIDYNERRRDTRIENDRGHAVEQMLFACNRLKNLTAHLLVSLVMVRSEVDDDAWWASSVAREIEFLNSHTVHHYAIVSRLIRAMGHETSDDLGVAPSTLKYRLEQQEYSSANY